MLIFKSKFSAALFNKHRRRWTPAEVRRGCENSQVPEACAAFQTRELVLKAVPFIGFSSLVTRRACGQDSYLRTSQAPLRREGGGKRGVGTEGLSEGTGWGQSGAARGRGPSRPCGQTGRAGVCPASASRSRVGGPGAPGSPAGVSSALSCVLKGRRSLSPSGTPTVPGASRGSESGPVVIPHGWPHGLSWHKEKKVTLQSCQKGRGPLHPPTSKMPRWPEMVSNPLPHCLPATFYRGPHARGRHCLSLPAPRRARPGPHSGSVSAPSRRGMSCLVQEPGVRGSTRCPVMTTHDYSPGGAWAQPLGAGPVTPSCRPRQGPPVPRPHASI